MRNENHETSSKPTLYDAFLKSPIDTGNVPLNLLCGDGRAAAPRAIPPCASSRTSAWGVRGEVRAGPGWAGGPGIQGGGSRYLCPGGGGEGTNPTQFSVFQLYHLCDGIVAPF